MDMFIYKYCFYPSPKLIGLKIKDLRKKRMYTAEKLAEKLNYETKTINKWEQGRGLPSLDQIIPLCKLLQTSIDELVFPQAKCIVDKDYSLPKYTIGYIDPEIYLYDFIENSDEFIDEELLNCNYDLPYLKLDYLLQKYIISWLSYSEKKEFNMFMDRVISYSSYLKTQSSKLNMNPSQYIAKYFDDKFGIGYRTNQSTDINELLYELNKFIVKKQFVSDYSSVIESFPIDFLLHKNDERYQKKLFYMIKYLNAVEKDIIYTSIKRTNNIELMGLADLLLNNGAMYLSFADDLDIEHNDNIHITTVNYIKKVNKLMISLSFSEYKEKRWCM